MEMEGRKEEVGEGGYFHLERVCVGYTNLRGMNGHEIRG
jgi:hypothetical protein